MALPKLLQKLFTNGGAGDKLNQDIIPGIPYSKITDVPSITVDSALSSTSENPVQNKVVKSALDGKFSTSGGNVNGDITFRNWGAGIGGTITIGDWYGFNSGTKWILGGNDGAGLWLSGNKSGGVTGSGLVKGEFQLSAEDGTNHCALRGVPDGSLRWGGHNVISVVAESYSANSWYRKYSDGWIEQGLVFTSTGSKNWATPFTSSPYTVLASSTINPTVSSTSITVSDMNYGPQAKQSKIYVYACGK